MLSDIQQPAASWQGRLQRCRSGLRYKGEGGSLAWCKAPFPAKDYTYKLLMSSGRLAYAVQVTPAHHAILLFLPWANVDDAHCHLNKHEMAEVKSASLCCLVPTEQYAVAFQQAMPSS